MQKTATMKKQEEYKKNRKLKQKKKQQKIKNKWKTCDYYFAFTIFKILIGTGQS